MESASLPPNVWQDVKSRIELKIMSGELRPGERIPSIRKIAEGYSVSQSTAQKVLNALWSEGVIDSKRGVGFFVNPYVREQLIAERKRDLEKKVIGVVEEAALINVDVVSMIEKCVEMKAGKK